MLQTLLLILILRFKGIPMAKKKITELELSLLHLQQNVEIPEISLNIHPVVQKTVEQAEQEGKHVFVDMIDQALLTDLMFLNNLQGDVNGWIKKLKRLLSWAVILQAARPSKKLISG